MGRTLKYARGASRMLAACLMFATLLVAGCGGGGGSGDGGFGDAPDYFPLSIGDRWVYRVSGTGITTYQEQREVTQFRSVLGHQAAVVEISDLSGGGATVEDFFAKTDDAVLHVPAPNADPLTLAVGPTTILELPVTAGASFSDSDTVSADVDGDGDSEQIGIVTSFTVVGFETVTVDAGTFTDVAHIRTTLTLTFTLNGNGQTQTVNGDTWYAPEVGIVREDISTTVAGQTASFQFVLTDFEVAGAGD